VYKCKLCERRFEDIPEDATILMGTSRTAIVVKLANGEVHDLRSIRKKKKQEELVHDPIPQESQSVSQEKAVSSEISPQPDNHPDRGTDALRNLPQEQEDDAWAEDSQIKV
jgi:hypothetical protein